MEEWLTNVGNVFLLDPGMLGMKRYDAAYLIDTGDTLALVDTGMTSSWDALVSELHRLGHNPEEVQHVFCTHPEHNYSGGNAFRFAELNPEVTVYANPLDARELTNPELEIARRKTAWATDATREKVGVPGRVPVRNIRMFEDGEIIDLNGYEIECIYGPGHQPGNTFYYDPQNKMMFFGDSLGNYFTDIDVMYQLYPGGANFRTLIESLEKVQSYDIEWVAVTHCGFSDNPHAVQMAIDRYKSILETAETLMREGRQDELYDAYLDSFTEPLSIIRASDAIGRGEDLYNYAMNEHLPEQATRFMQECASVYFPHYA